MTQAPAARPPYIGPDGQPYVDLWQTEGSRAGPALGQNGSYSCELYGRKAVQHIEAHNASTPLFFYVAFHDTHSPLQCPERYLPGGYKPNSLSGPDHARTIYEGMLTCVSIATGNITNALKSKGMWDNSLIVWSADNGGPAFTAANNFPLRGGKMTDWQGGVRVAAFATGGLIPKDMHGTVVNGAMHVRCAPILIVSSS